MQELITLTTFLPALTILVGLFLMIFYVKKSSTVNVLISLAVAGLFYYICDAIITNPFAEPQLMIWATVAVPFLSPLSLGFIICLVWVLYYEKPLPWHQFLWFVLPVALSSVCVVLFMLVGSEDAEQFQSLYDKLRHYPESYNNIPVFRMLHFIEHTLYGAVLFTYSVWAVIFSIYVLRRTGFNHVACVGFFFKRASLPPVHILLLSFIALLSTIVVRVVLGRYFLMDHLWANIFLSFVQSFCMLLILLAAFSLDYVECTWRQYWFLAPREDLNHTNDASDDDDDDATDAVTYLSLQDRLENGLHEIMDEQHAYLDCNLRMTDVARSLGTNRNYLSRHINEKYHMNFNEYVNRMRIEYSKDFMLKNPDMLLDTIAVECGFCTAQVFGRKFKAMEGIAPRTWLVQQTKE